MNESLLGSTPFSRHLLHFRRTQHGPSRHGIKMMNELPFSSIIFDGGQLALILYFQGLLSSFGLYGRHIEWRAHAI